MNLYRPNRQTERGRRRLIFATVFVIIVLLLDAVSGGRVRALVRETGAWAYEQGAGIGHAIAASGFFSSRASLAAQNELLQEQITSLQEKVATMSIAQQESDQLAALVHLVQKSPGITAPVVSSVDASPYGTFVIGAGSEEGIHAGEFVLTPGGYVVGTIHDVGAHTSLVVETFAPGSLTHTVITSTAAELKGRGGGNAEAEIPRAASVVEGDIAIAPDLGARPVGVVQSIASSSASASQRILLRLPENLGSLEYVYVVSN